jgi:hypothetical protein
MYNYYYCPNRKEAPTFSESPLPFRRTPVVTGHPIIHKQGGPYNNHTSGSDLVKNKDKVPEHLCYFFSL